MGIMDQNTFFTDKNKDLIYTICRDEIQKQTQYNIDNNRKYYKTFGEIMKIIYKHSNNSNDLTELNNKTIGKTIPYITEQINNSVLSSARARIPTASPELLPQLTAA